jgi:single-stranded-DNA-specific exonuclease
MVGVEEGAMLMEKRAVITVDGQDKTLPAFIVNLLNRRGVADEGFSRFLYPRLADLPHPDKMKNLTAAARLAVAAISDDRPIVIWGDYDVDGTTGTALLVHFFRELGVEVTWYIPNRLSEGYGLHSDWFCNRQKCCIGGDFLLITVDCGVSNHREVAIVKELGGKVIITDHHAVPKEGVPDCLVVNPSQKDCGFHGEKLAGVGLAFYLAAAVRSELGRLPEQALLSHKINLKKYLPFVALGTIADMVDLTPTNRILVRSGIEALESTEFYGLTELLSCHQITGSRLTSEDIGYLLAPKINAPGRLGDSSLAVSLLVAENKRLAKKMADKLICINDERKRVCENNFENALASLSRSAVAEQGCAIVCGEMHLGVAGIVAARLVEEFAVPALVLAKMIGRDGSSICSGSARSVDGVNMVELLEQCSPYLLRFGGHAMAAGLSLLAENFLVFSQMFSSLARNALTTRDLSQQKKEPQIHLSVDQLMAEEHLDLLQLLEPYGPGNPQPIFHDAAARVVDVRAIGRDFAHLQLTIRGKYRNYKGVGFHLGKRLAEIQSSPQRKMSYTPTLNRFRGTVSWQVRVIDL